MYCGVCPMEGVDIKNIAETKCICICTGDSMKTVFLASLAPNIWELVHNL